VQPGEGGGVFAVLSQGEEGGETRNCLQKEKIEWGKEPTSYRDFQDHRGRGVGWEMAGGGDDVFPKNMGGGGA